MKTDNNTTLSRGSTAIADDASSMMRDAFSADISADSLSSQGNSEPGQRTSGTRAMRNIANGRTVRANKENQTNHNNQSGFSESINSVKHNQSLLIGAALGIVTGLGLTAGYYLTRPRKRFNLW